AQFSNASGGDLVIGAYENNHVVDSFADVSDPDGHIHWIADVLKGNLEPVPPIDPHVISAPAGERLVVIGVPPSPVLIARKSGEGYEFPIRGADGKRYMTLIEVEARMGDRERLMKLRIHQIPRYAQVSLDAHLPPEVHPREWSVEKVDDHTVTLAKGALRVDVPLSYVEAVYPTNEQGATWVIAMDCWIQQIDHRLRVRKFKP